MNMNPLCPKCDKAMWQIRGGRWKCFHCEAPTPEAAAPAYAMRKFSRMPWAKIVDLMADTTARVDADQVTFQYKHPDKYEYRDLVIADNGGEVNVFELVPALPDSIPLPDRCDPVEFAGDLAERLQAMARKIPSRRDGPAPASPGEASGG